MKKILIYGDSNVWGDNFFTQERIDEEKQWPIILQKKLIKDYIIYQEGLPGRLAGNNEVIKKYKNGKDNFLSTLKTKSPLDTIIIMLGTNDLQIKYNKEAKEIIEDLLWYKEITEKEYEDIDNKKKYFNNKFPRFIYILPPNFNAKEVFNEKSEKNRQEIIKYFKETTIEHIVLENIPLFEDNIHLNYQGHQILADLVERKLYDNTRQTS